MTLTRVTLMVTTLIVTKGNGHDGALSFHAAVVTSEETSCPSRPYLGRFKSGRLYR
jgi:hypothetical protein